MAAKKNDFRLASFWFRRKFETNTFPKEFFNEIWLKLGDHRYINIAEIKFGKYYSGGILGAKHIFLHPQNVN